MDDQVEIESDVSTPGNNGISGAEPRQGNIVTIKCEDSEKLKLPNIKCSFPLNDEDSKYINMMIAECNKDDVLGIAAPQVGYNRRIFVMNHRGEKVVVINPTILSQSGKTNSREGCLSSPGIHGTIKRPKEIEIEYYSVDGIQHKSLFTGRSASIVSHEIDHLNGVLIYDKLFTSFVSKVSHSANQRAIKTKEVSRRRLKEKNRRKQNKR